VADVHRRATVGTARMSADEIANRGFASAFRGLSETEVRSYLKRVSEEFAAAATREAELAATIDDLREQLRNPAPVTEQQLLDSLGEETARVLRSAQEAAEEIRSRAEERAATLVREAQEQATELREGATADATRRTEDAERLSSEREQAADAYATRARDDAERDATAARDAAARDAEESRAAAAAAAEAEVEAAKETGRGLVQEARTVRERMLDDLARRRELLQSQIDELRAGRDRLLDAYRVVKRTLGEATDALAQVEARAETELTRPPDAAAAAAEVPAAVRDADAAEDRAGTGAAMKAAAEGSAAVGAADAPAAAEVPAAVRDADAVAAAEGSAAVGAADAPAAAEVPAAVRDADAAEDRAGTGAAIRDESEGAVDALFARLRSAEPAPAPEPAGVEPAAVAPEPDAAPEAEAAGDEPRAVRARVLDPLGAELTRKAKRRLQDEQNELLDRIRQVKKGRAESAAVLTSEADASAAWAKVIGDAVDAAYRGGWEQLAGAASTPPAPSELVTTHAEALVGLLRERLVVAIDEPADDGDVVTQRISARFREFKGQELEAALGDLLATIWARGAFDAAPAGARLQWIPTVEGHCADCDDNALEPTVRGEPFPTGQPHPPAHPGCRCLLVIAEP